MPTLIAERLVALLRPGHALEHQPHRRALAHRLHLRGHVREHAVLGGDLPAGDDLVGHLQQPRHAAERVVRRVDADDAVAGAEATSPRRSRRGCPRRSRSGGWAGSGEPSVPRRPMVLSQCLTTRILLAASIRSRFDISLVTAAIISAVRPSLSRLIISSVVVLGQQPFPQLADRPALDLGVDGLVDRVVDDARDLVLVVRARPGWRAGSPASPRPARTWPRCARRRCRRRSRPAGRPTSPRWPWPAGP